MKEQRVCLEGGPTMISIFPRVCKHCSLKESLRLQEDYYINK